MANNCYNHIEFVGLKKNIERLAKAFHSLQKETADLTLTQACDKVFGLKSPPDSEYAHYGTKWFNFTMGLPEYGEPFHVEGFEDMPPLAYGSFNLIGDSAWSPPILLVEELCRAYSVEATHHYDESGCDFGGVFKADKNGEVAHEQYTYLEYLYTYDYDAWWEEIVYQIQEDAYQTFEHCVEENPYADLDNLNEAWNEVKPKDKDQ